MIRFFILLFITQSMLFSCALCAYYSPVTHVSLKVNSTNQTITTIDFKWELSAEFTKQLLEIYDTNLNKKIDNSEIGLIETALLNYVKGKNFMTYISYSKEANSKAYLTNTVRKYKTLMQDGILNFQYTVELNLLLQPTYKLHIYVNDDENYFTLLFNKNWLIFKNKVAIQKEIVDIQNVVFTIDAQAPIQEENQSVQESKIEEIKQEEQRQIKKETILEEFTQKVKLNLQKVQQGDTAALFILLFISFGYGMVHAVGPGHGKALAFSYFSSHKSSFSKAFFISLGSSFIHIIGALILVLVSLFILESFFNSFVEDSVAILTKISAGMIMALAAYLLFSKLANKKCVCHSCQNSEIKWSTTKPIPSKTKSKFVKKDLYFVLTAGLIPCPGTVILFIYAFVLKTYFAVFLAAVFICLGMAVVMFASSFLGIGVQKFGEKSHKITRIVEIVSPMFMFILGALLLASVVF